LKNKALAEMSPYLTFSSGWMSLWYTVPYFSPNNAVTVILAEKLMVHDCQVEFT